MVRLLKLCTWYAIRAWLKPNCILRCTYCHFPTLIKPHRLLVKRMRKWSTSTEQPEAEKAIKLPISSKTAPDIDRKMVKRPTPIKKYPAKLPEGPKLLSVT